MLDLGTHYLYNFNTMIHRFVILLISSFISFPLQAALNLPELLYPLIEQELAQAKLELDKNTISSQEEIASLKNGLDTIWLTIQKEGVSKNSGVDKNLRGVYITMQGIIESAITRALQRHMLENAIVHIVTPRMPTPLMIKGGSALHEIDLNDPQSFAKYRNPILVNFLKAGGVINAFYSHDAQYTCSEQTAELENYALYCNEYSNLFDQPCIKIDHSKFPVEMTGAIYVVDGLPITIESRQVTQIDNVNQQFWAIKFGEYAQLRKNKIDSFLEIFLRSGT